MTNNMKMSERAEDMEQNRCFLIKNILSQDLCKFLSIQTEIDEYERTPKSSTQVPGSVELYDSIATQITNNIVLEKLKNSLKLEKIYSTYGFFRKYYKFQNLKKHTDRPECELSISICLDMHNEREPWEIFFENKKQNIVYAAKPEIGDGVVYMGMELPHWRESCQQKWLKQIFLHYTFNKELEFDLKNTENPDKTKLTKTLIKIMSEQY